MGKTKSKLTKLLRLRSAGMFSNVNEVVDQLHLAEQGDYQFAIQWDRSCYKVPKRPADPWRYYFKPCFAGELSESPEVLPGGAKVVCSPKSIITPRLKEGRCRPLLLPANREQGAEIINRYIHLRPGITKRIEEFYAKHFRGNKVVGLHLRGLGRDASPAGALRRATVAKGEIDYVKFVVPVDKYLDQNPGALVFACSDSQDVIDHLQHRYGSKLIATPSVRSEFGELHSRPNCEANRGFKFSRHRLGLDALLDAYLLARTDFLVHGSSNLTNYVLCLDPLLPSFYVYHDIKHA